MIIITNKLSPSKDFISAKFILKQPYVNFGKDDVIRESSLEKTSITLDGIAKNNHFRA